MTNVEVRASKGFSAVGSGPLGSNGTPRLCEGGSDGSGEPAAFRGALAVRPGVGGAGEIW
jgi:hypothetical protein